MAVLDNLKGIAKSLKIKQKESSIGRDAVHTSTVESKFLNEYETFKVGLLSWIEKFIINDGNKAIVIKAKTPNAERFLRYTLEDADFANVFQISQKAGGEYVYTLDDSLDSILDDDFGAEEEENEQEENIVYI